VSSSGAGSGALKASCSRSTEAELDELSRRERHGRTNMLSAL
jgi:hypothetical protein